MRGEACRNRLLQAQRSLHSVGKHTAIATARARLLRSPLAIGSPFANVRSSQCPRSPQNSALECENTKVLPLKTMTRIESLDDNMITITSCKESHAYSTP